MVEVARDLTVQQTIVVEMEMLSSWKVVDGMMIGMTCEIDPYIRTTGSVEHLVDEKIVVQMIELEKKTRCDVDSEVV